MNYDAVSVYTGQPAPFSESGFFQPPVTLPEGLSAEQARAVAEVRAALIIASCRPRNELQARERLLQACRRVGLASCAVYRYRRGGGRISGPSIRLAETAARAWGNINYGFRELSRTSGVSECEAFAWDLETNTRAVRQFTVRHRRDTGNGGSLTEERDLYELMACQAQRRVRAAILEIIPGDIIEEALELCERTMRAATGDTVAAAEALAKDFAALGVPREALEKSLGHRLEEADAAQLLKFRNICTSIKDGMSLPKDWFDLSSATPSEASDVPPAPVSGKKGRKKAAPKPAGGRPEQNAPVGDLCQKQNAPQGGEETVRAQAPSPGEEHPETEAEPWPPSASAPVPWAADDASEAAFHAPDTGN